MSDSDTLESALLRAHPWHGVDPVIAAGERLVVYIETIQFDTMKYEVDAASGLLRIERPQRTLPPYPYGFVPRTLCGARVAELSNDDRADGAPLDVFVISERAIGQRGTLAEVRCIGGFPVSDNGLADDKLIGILARDPTLGAVEDIGDLPVAIIDRVQQFLQNDTLDEYVHVGEPYGKKLAAKVVAAALEDYSERYQR